MFSSVSIKAKKIIINERIERCFNYGFCGAAAYVITQVTAAYLSGKLGYKIPKNVENALASLANFGAQTAASELITNPRYPESSRTGKRFLDNIASTVGIFADIHSKLFVLQNETMSIIFTGLISGIVGEKVCSHMNVVLEKSGEKKNNSTEQLQKIIEEKKEYQIKCVKSLN